MALTTEETTVIKNTRTETIYANDAEASADVADPNTDTTEADVSRSVTLNVLKGVQSEGQA